MTGAPARRRAFMRARIVLLASLLVAGAFAVVQRAWDLQLRRSPQLREMAEEQYLREVKLSPKRGTVLDRGGAELAVSVDVDSVFANPRALRAQGADPSAIAQRLAALLDVDAEVLAARLHGERHFVWVKRRVTPAQGKAIRLARLPGVSISAEARRYYPNRELAAHVLGFANVDGAGIEGLELALDDRLRGPQSAGKAVLDRRGEVVFSERLLDDRAAHGDDVVLTIDKTIQHVAERELELAVRTYEAHAGSIVVYEPRTGEIFAMANYPTFNPNEPGRAGSAHRRNRAVTDRFEPGSTVKPFTLAAALAAGAVSPTESIDCQDGALRVAEHTIHDSHKWGKLTPSQVLAVSSNIGTAKIGLALGRAGLYRALTRFGFGEVTGSRLPGETAGILRHHRRWYEMDAATIAFGQGFSATALQLAVATGALANEGRLMQPTLIRRVIDAHGVVVEQATPRVRRQVVPPEVARLVSSMLIGVTGPGGTGAEAAIDGYLVAGKTGTAQKADYVRGGYADHKWSSSFIGYAPAHRPRVLAAVVIDEPTVAHHGGAVAAPVFRRVMSAALRHLGVSPDTTGTIAELAAQSRKARAEAEAAVTQLGAASVPPAPEPAVQAGQVLVPDTVGRPARAAVALARAAELEVRLQGSGVVTSQEPSAGSVAARGSTLTLQLASPVTSVARQPEAVAAVTAGDHDG